MYENDEPIEPVEDVIYIRNVSDQETKPKSWNFVNDKDKLCSGTQDLQKYRTAIIVLQTSLLTLES